MLFLSKNCWSKSYVNISGISRFVCNYAEEVDECYDNKAGHKNIIMTFLEVFLFDRGHNILGLYKILIPV